MQDPISAVSACSAVRICAGWEETKQVKTGARTRGSEHHDRQQSAFDPTQEEPPEEAF